MSRERTILLASLVGVLGLTVACAGTLVILWYSPSAGAPGGVWGTGNDYARERAALLDHIQSGGLLAEFVEWGPHLRLTEQQVQRMGNPGIVRPGDVIVRAVVRTTDRDGTIRREDVLAFMHDGQVQMARRPLRGLLVLGAEASFMIENRWGKRWPDHIEADVRRFMAQTD